MSESTVILKPERDASIYRKHHWIFSGAIQKIIGDPEEGDLVKIQSAQGKIIGYGHCASSTIAIRVLQFIDEPVDHSFWVIKIKQAFLLRSALGLSHSKETNAYRLIHGEGDGLPGLIIDIYALTAIIQCHSLGMIKAIENIVAALKEVMGDRLQSIYNKSKETLGETKITFQNNFLFGHQESCIIKENDYSFLVNWQTGQKTGFFLDQRENRMLLGTMAANKSVLNLFAYTGGFSVYALENNATQVTSVDSSKTAMAILEENMSLLKNNSKVNHLSVESTVQDYLRNAELFDIIICDPPAFAKSMNKRHQAVQGYKNLNAKVMQKVKSGGFLFTFSCSQVMDRELFQQTILAAALEAKKEVQIVKTLSQGPDHPVNLFHPEGAYLKGLLLYIQ